MFVPPKEFQRTADAAARIIDVANQLLDAAKMSSDTQVTMMLTEQVKELFAIASSLNDTIKNVTSANTASRAV